MNRDSIRSAPESLDNTPLPPSLLLPWLEVKHLDSATVLRFIATSLVDEEVIQAIANRVQGMIENAGKRLIIMDLSSITHLSSLMIAKLVAFNRKVKAGTGRLIFCGLQPDVLRALERLQLLKILMVCADEQEALRFNA
jgi:anti-anti-sigma factor